MAVIIAACLLAPTFAAALPGNSAGVWGAWLPETVDAGHTNSGVGSVIRLADDRVHVLFSWVGRVVAYGVRDLTGWNVSVLHASGHGDGFDIDANGVAHFAVDIRSPQSLWYVQLDGSQRIEELITPLPYIFSNGELHVDSLNRPHVVWQQGDDTIRHAYRVGANDWHVELVASSAEEVDFAIDSEDRIHVAYKPRPPYENRLKYGIRDANGVWAFEDAPGCFDEHDLALDSRDYPHISCHRINPSGFGYAWKDDAGWHSETIISGQRYGRWTAIEVDSNDRPHIAYHNWFNTAIPDLPTQRSTPEYAVKTANGWMIETIDHDGTGNGFDPSITLDEHDRPHVAYVQGWRLLGVPYRGTCDEIVDVCYNLRYATPAASVLALAGE